MPLFAPCFGTQQALSYIYDAVVGGSLLTLVVCLFERHRPRGLFIRMPNALAVGPGRGGSGQAFYYFPSCSQILARHYEGAKKLLSSPAPSAARNHFRKWRKHMLEPYALLRSAKQGIARITVFLCSVSFARTFSPVSGRSVGRSCLTRRGGS